MTFINFSRPGLSGFIEDHRKLMTYAIGRAPPPSDAVTIGRMPTSGRESWEIFDAAPGSIARSSNGVATTASLSSRLGSFSKAGGSGEVG
jgi:hypothetical protein